MIGHNGNFAQWQRGVKGHWCSSFGLLWLGDCSIELLEETEDSQAERKWIAQLDCVNTARMEFGIGDQYDSKAANKHHYYAKHELCLQQKRNSVSKHRAATNERARLKRYENYEQTLIQERLRYQQRKESQCAQKRERIICDRCGIEISRGDKARHQRIKKCQTIYAAITSQ